ncbi:MAG: hypothetical protein FJZ56_00115 [Chlamydiae bacterium]|nr:hypothetical protein [Chlamydiota bacterium]
MITNSHATLIAPIALLEDLEEPNYNCCDILWQIALKIYEFFHTLFFCLCCDLPDEEGAKVRWKLQDSQFSIISPIASISPPGKICTVESLEASKRYLENRMKSKEEVSKALLVGGLRALSALKIAPHFGDEQIEALYGRSYSQIKHALQRQFNHAALNQRNSVLQAIREQLNSIGAADSQKNIEEFRESIHIGATGLPDYLVGIHQYANYYNQHQRNAAWLQNTHSTTETNAEAEYTQMIDKHISYSKNMDESYRERLSAVFTINRGRFAHSHMVGMSLDQNGNVEEAAFFDSNAHGQSNKGIYRLWRQEEGVDPKQELIKHLIKLTIRRDQVTTFSYAPIELRGEF